MKKQFILTFAAFLLVSAFIVFQSGAIDTVTAAHTHESTVSVENVSFNNDILPILQERCTKCHGGEFPTEGLSLTSYEALLAGSQNGQVIIPGDSNNSLLFEKVESGEMPKRGSDLTAEQIELIQQWIDEGALNN
jgi:uncharacterized membrane protein